MAPHFAASPHIAAPHVAHMAAHQHMAAPHLARPHIASPAVPHGGPRFATSHGAPPHIAAERGGPRGGRFASAPSRLGAEHAARELSRHGSSEARPSEAHALEHARSNPQATTAERQQPSVRGRETVGQGPESRVGPKGNKGDLSRLEQRQPQQQRAPIIRNPVFASQQPSRRGEALSPSTFRGRFMQSGLYDRRHHHHLGIVLGFVGPLFWPYAYSDFVDYTYSPYAYDTFWPYAFDDVYAGIYGGYAPAYDASEDAYAYAGSSGSERVYDRATNQTVGSTARSASAERICSGQAQGLTDFSIQKIADQVQPDQKQRDLLNALKDATIRAVNILQRACPGELPSTPTGRLAAMRARVDAMLKAVEVVAPALDQFYRSLSDEQRERFIALDQNEQTASRKGGSDLNHLCQGQIGAKSDLPVAKIERTLRLDGDQDQALRALDQATMDSAKMLQAKCQPDQQLTPTGRLAAMRDRLQAVSQALQMTQSALMKFYGSLSDEQKARFDRMSVRAS